MSQIRETKGYEWVKAIDYTEDDGGHAFPSAVAIQSTQGWLLLVRHETIRDCGTGCGGFRTVLVRPDQLRDESIITPP